MTSSHHGASTHASNSQDWATSTAPDVLVSSAGNKFFHPRCDATDRFNTLPELRQILDRRRKGPDGSDLASDTYDTAPFALCGAVAPVVRGVVLAIGTNLVGGAQPPLACR